MAIISSLSTLMPAVKDSIAGSPTGGQMIKPVGLGSAFGGGGGLLGFFDGLSELSFRGDLSWEEAAAAEFVDGVVFAAGLDGSGGFLSSGIDGDVFKFGHGVGA